MTEFIRPSVGRFCTRAVAALGQDAPKRVSRASVTAIAATTKLPLRPVEIATTREARTELEGCRRLGKLVSRRDLQCRSRIEGWGLGMWADRRGRGRALLTRI